MPGISENYGSSPLEGVLSGHIRLSRRTACRYDNVGYFGGTAAWPNHAFRRTLHTSARYLATSINFVGDTLPRASAPRDNPCRKSAEEFRLVFDLCKSDGRMYLCALILNLRRARDEPPKATDRSFRALIMRSAVKGTSLSLIYNRIIRQTWDNYLIK